MRRRGRPAALGRRPSPTTPCFPTPSTGARARQGPDQTPLLSPPSRKPPHHGSKQLQSPTPSSLSPQRAPSTLIIQSIETYVLTAYTSLSARRFAPLSALRLRLALSYQLFPLQPRPAAHEAPLPAAGGFYAGGEATGRLG